MDLKLNIMMCVFRTYITAKKKQLYNTKIQYQFTKNTDLKNSSYYGLPICWPIRQYLLYLYRYPNTPIGLLLKRDVEISCGIDPFFKIH